MTAVGSITLEDVFRLARRQLEVQRMKAIEIGINIGVKQNLSSYDIQLNELDALQLILKEYFDLVPKRTR